MTVISSVEKAAIDLVEDTKATASTVLTTIANRTVTVGGLMGALGTTDSFIPAMIAAVKAKNFELEAELTLSEAVAIAAAIGVPYAGLAKVLLPFLFYGVNNAPDLFTGSIPQVTTDLEDNLQDRFEQGKSR